LLNRCDDDAAVVKMSRKVFLFNNHNDGAPAKQGERTGGDDDAEISQSLTKKARSTLDADDAQPSSSAAAASVTVPNSAATVGKKNAQLPLFSSSSTQVGSHPFVTEYGDHFETPLEAYAHIAPALILLAEKLEVPMAQLRIYDPFYCAGKEILKQGL